MTDVSTTCAEAIFRAKMASAQVVETSVTNNSPSQDSNHPDHLFQSRNVTPGLKAFSYGNLTLISDLQIGVRGRLRVRVSSSEHAHFEISRPPNLKRVLSTENSYS